MISFTAEVYFLALGQYNAAIWPAQLLAIALALCAAAIACRPAAGAGRIVSGILAAMWLWTGVVFLWAHFATISFAAPVIAACFVAQGLMLLWSAAIRGTPVAGGCRGAFGALGLALAVAALALHPLLAWASGHGWQQADIVGVGPDSTALLTVALLLLTPRPALHLLLVPVLWAVAAALTAWSLSSPVLLVLPALSLAGAVLAIARRVQPSAA